MLIFFKCISIPVNHIGFLFKKNRLRNKLESGIYHYFDPLFYLKVYSIPITSKLVTITNQEVLTKDNVAFRFSYYIKYKIENGELFLSSFDLEKSVSAIIIDAEEYLHKITQLRIRNLISSLSSEELNEKRNEISNFMSNEMIEESKKYGLLLEEVTLRDITFPKTIQDLFSKLLESKIRSQADLENARTNVATARALKNASEIMKGDENIKFFHFLETLTKIASKGTHNFYFGNFSESLGIISNKTKNAN